MQEPCVPTNHLDTYLKWLRVTATLVFIAGLCVSVALIVIAFIPGSPAHADLPAQALSGLNHIQGVDAGVAVQRSGWLPFAVDDPSLAQRLLYLLTMLPGLLVIAEIARRMGAVVHTAEASNPFTEETAGALITIGRLTALAGLAAWAVSEVAGVVLARTMMDSADHLRPHHSPLGWLAVGLILAGFGVILERGVEMRAELDTLI
jgi:hypothetical protein